MENYLDDHFNILDQIGEGANAVVYKAEQKSTQQIVAVKKLKIDTQLTSEKSKKMIARFKRETEICAQLNHPNIVKIIDTGLDQDKYPFAVYEYVSGETLKSYIQKKGVLSGEETKLLMEQVLEALCAAHEKGIVHRDLKPQNIMVFTSGAKTYVKVLDFGIGAITHQFKPFDQTQLTMTEDVVGTPIYAAPEQLRGGMPSTQSDLYAWGLITLECLTGTTVLSGNTLAEVFHQHLALSNIPLPAAIVDHELGSFLRKILEKSLDRRVKDTQEVLARFQTLNFSTLVGNIGVKNDSPEEASTVINHLSSSLPKVSKKNITVLAIKIRAQRQNNNIDLETLEAVQKDQINSIKDLAIQFGGYLAMSYAHHLVVYFGYPEAGDSFVRRAGKTALFIKDEMARRNENLEINFGITFNVKMAIHTGEALVKQNEVPEGILPELAIEQLSVAPLNRVLCSETSHELLRKNYHLEKLHTQNSQELQGTFYELLAEKEADTLSATLSSIVGRTAEKKELENQWLTFKETNTVPFCLLHGEAGIGKSNLIASFCNILKKEQEKFVILQAIPEGQNSALKPFLAYLLQTLNKDKQEGIDNITALATLAESFNAEEIEQQVAVLCAWLGINYKTQATNLQLSPQKQKQIVFQFLGLFLKNLNQGNRHVLIVEDAHWLDPTSLEFIQTLTTEQELPFFTVLSSRNKEVLKLDNIAQIKLTAMDAKETEALCAQLLEYKSIAPKALEYITQKANGIPLYVEELILMLVQQGFLILDTSTDTYSLNKTQKLDTIPAKLSDLLHARLDQLMIAKPMVQAAAVLGRFFNLSTLKHITNVDADTIEKSISELLKAKIIIVDQQDGDYLFRHALIRDAAYNSILNQQRKTLHLNAAKILDQQKTEKNIFEIAEHYALGDQYKEAVNLGKKAAKNALSKSMNQETVDMCTKVEKWIESSALLEKDLNLLLSLKTININGLMAIYGWASPLVKEAAMNAFTQLNKTDSKTLEKSTITEIYWALIMYYHVASERDQMGILAKQFKQVTEEHQEEDMLISAMLFEGIYYYLDGDDVKALVLLEKAYELSKDKNSIERYLTIDIDNEVHLLSVMCLLYWKIGEKEKAHKYGEEAIEIAKEINHVPSLCLALFYLAACYYFERNQNKTQELAQEIVALSDKHGLVAYGAYGVILLNWAMGQKEPIDQIIAQLEFMGCKLGLTLYKSMVADLYIQEGNYDAAWERIEQCLNLCEINKEYYYKKNLLEVKNTLRDKINISI